jgi:EthD domain
MQKLIAVIARPEGVDRTAFHERLLAQARRCLRESSDPKRFIVNLVDVEPPPEAANVAQRYDAVLECWFEAIEDFTPWAQRRLATPEAGTVWVYHVSERVQLDSHPEGGADGRSPGIKTIYLVRRREGLDDREAKRRWQEHALLARRHHVGMSRYVQNDVVAALKPGAPVVHGIAELTFPTREDLEKRMYGSVEGRQAIASDAAGPVAEATPLYTSEYILRA